MRVIQREDQGRRVAGFPQHDRGGRLVIHAMASWWPRA
jgi:hypothetical protein